MSAATSLLEAPPELEHHAAELREIPLEELHESPKNPRKHYEPIALQQLADNLAAAGQITPVVVRPRPAGGYELAAGHRRLRAAKLAGLTHLEAKVREMDEAQFVEALNIENLQRDDLNALEEAQGFVTLMKDASYDVPKIAERVGRSIKYVYDRLKLLQLIPAAKKLLEEGTITPGHGILLARLSKDDQERALAADEGTYRSGGLLERESINESYFPGDPQLALDDGPKKARSVRELHQWIDRNVRFVPEKVNQQDLAFDLPATAELLGSAKNQKLKVLKITRELAWVIWTQRDAGGLDESIRKAIDARWTAKRKADKAAEAKAAPVQASAKKKKLAGDVRRQKKAKAAKTGRK